MAGPTNERGLVARIMKAVSAEYPQGWWMKVHGGPYQMAGVPDVILCIDGMFIGMEVKFARPGESEASARERTTPGQRLQIRKINDAGGMAGVVTSPDQALDLISRAYQKRERRDGTRNLGQ